MKLFLSLMLGLSINACMQKTSKKVSVFERNKLPDFPSILDSSQNDKNDRSVLSEAILVDSVASESSPVSSFNWDGESDLSSDKVTIEEGM